VLHNAFFECLDVFVIACFFLVWVVWVRRALEKNGFVRSKSRRVYSLISIPDIRSFTLLYNQWTLLISLSLSLSHLISSHSIRLSLGWDRRGCAHYGLWINDFFIFVKKGFLGELRSYAMKLHTREQAPREGEASADKAKPMKEWAPTREGYLQYLVDSKVVYDCLESIVEENTEYEAFRSTGLERGEPLAADIAFFEKEYGMTVPSASSAGQEYAALLTDLSKSSPPAFMCHYYNVYFAHTAGGRAIGKQLSDALLEKKTLAFYQWEGTLKDHMDGVRASINGVAETWSAEEKQACLEATAPSFQYAGSLLRLLA